MGWRTCLAASAAALFLSAPAGAAAPFTLDGGASSAKPSVAVDPSGVGHFAWNEASGPAQSDVLHYCRIPRNGRACTHARSFTVPAGAGERAADDAGPEVFLPDDDTVVLFTRRCCPARGYTFVSHDGGDSFGAVNDAGDNAPSGDGVLGPGSFAVSTITSGEPGGVYFQTFPFERGRAPSARANVGDQGRAEANPDQDGTIGFAAPLKPVVALSDGVRVYVRAFGRGTAFNDLASWGPLTTPFDGADPHLASGPRGLFLIYRTPDPGSHYEVRRWNGSGFPAPGVRVSAGPGGRDFFEDAGGGVHAVYSLADALIHSVSSNGGRSFRTTTLARTESFGEPRGAAARDGGGWTVWSPAAGGVRAVQYGPTGRIGEPPAASACVPTLRIGAATVLAAGCGFTRRGRTDTYTTDGDIRVNGIDVLPGSARLTLDRSARSITSTAAVQTRVGALRLGAGRIDWRIPAGAGGPITGRAGRLLALETSKLGTRVLGLRVSGQTFPSVDNRGGSSLKAELALPAPLTGATGAGVTGSATLRADNARGLSLSGLGVKVPNTSLGLARVKSFELVRTGEPSLLQGAADVALPGLRTRVRAALVLSNGRFERADADTVFNPPLPLFTKLDLDHIAFHTQASRGCRRPTSLSLRAGVVLGGGGKLAPVARFEGAGAYDLPRASCQAPGRLTLDGSGRLVEFDAASSHLRLTTFGQVSFGGRLFTPGQLSRLMEMTADYEGGFDRRSGAWYAAGTTRGTLLGLGTFSAADFLASEAGARACAEIASSEPGIPVLEGGFHYIWGRGAQVDYPGCEGDLSRYRPAGLRSGARVFDVAGGTASAMVRIEGPADAPGAILIDPRGRRILVPAAPAVGAQGKGFKVVRIPSRRAAFVQLTEPAAGRWQAVAQPGSAISAVATATGLRAPSVKGRVTGTGRALTLGYTLRGIAGQRVRVFERDRETAHLLGELKPGRHRLGFRPADGSAGTRALVALVESRGVPRATISVARFSAPGPARPGQVRRVRLARRGTSLRVTWTNVSRANRYAVREVLRDGRRKEFVTTRRSLTIAAIGRQASGRLSVTAIGADGLLGRAGSAELSG